MKESGPQVYFAQLTCKVDLEVVPVKWDGLGSRPGTVKEWWEELGKARKKQNFSK